MFPSNYFTASRWAKDTQRQASQKGKHDRWIASCQADQLPPKLRNSNGDQIAVIWDVLPWSIKDSGCVSSSSDDAIRKTLRNFVGLAQSQFIYFKFLVHSRCPCLSRFLPSGEWQIQVPCQIGAVPSSTPACPGIPVFTGGFCFLVVFLLFCCWCFCCRCSNARQLKGEKHTQLTHGRFSWCTLFHPHFFG